MIIIKCLTKKYKIMKKYYLAPTIKVVKLQTVGMLAYSTNNGLREGGLGNPSGADSRSFDFDED